MAVRVRVPGCISLRVSNWGSSQSSFKQGLVVLFTYTCFDLRQPTGISPRMGDRRGAEGEVRAHVLPPCLPATTNPGWLEAPHSCICYQFCWITASVVFIHSNSSCALGLLFQAGHFHPAPRARLVHVDVPLHQ